MSAVSLRRTTRSRRSRWLAALGLLVALGTAGVLAGAHHYRLTSPQFLREGTRWLATPVYAWVYREDLATSAGLAAGYRVGNAALADRSSRTAWTSLAERTPGLQVISVARDIDRLPEAPFVYERAETDRLTTLLHTYHLEALTAGAPSEYESMLALAAWLGTRWDHGTSPLEGTPHICEPVEVIRAGESGARYWCEVAARTTVHAAAALGWPARVVTSSRDGYTWEHAVAEFWSNQFAKWFVVDTDFNIVYEEAGVPLSAWELSARGLELQRQGRLTVRRFAPPKPSLVDQDLMPFYAYVHVDMRTDWCDRPLSPGSPAGGDRATWWTARPALGSVLSARVRVDDPSVFNWPVNVVAVHPSRATAGPALQLSIDLVAYSPVFEGFEVGVDNGRWQRADQPAATFELAPGTHTIRARVRTRTGEPGPASEVVVAYTAPR